MRIGILRIVLHLPASHSLKAKRHVVAGLLKMVRSQFGVAAAEIGEGDRWQLAEIGVACVSNETAHADEVMASVVRFVEARAGDAVLTKVSTEVLKIA
jgi:uncharacterized protein YlxP (DUF503 family)